MDVYSYGLLSYWILFASCSANLKTFSKDLSILKDSLAKHQLRDIVVQRIPESSQRETLIYDLEEFLYGCLSSDPQKRFQIVSQNIGLLRDIVPGIQITIAETHQQHTQFDLASSMDQLLQVDYRIRKNLFKVFQESLDSTCSDCAQNGALQLSLYHTIGFGTSRDLEAVDLFVSSEKILMSDLQQRLEIIRECRFPERPGQAKWYVEPDLVSSYQESGDLQIAVEWHTREVENLRECLGISHRLVAMATTTLALLLDEAGQTSKALSLCTEQHREITSRFGEDHHDAVAAKSQVALYQWKNGDTMEAIATGEQLAELLRTSQSIKETDRLALACFSNLAGAYVGARRHRQAIPIMERLMILHDKVLGQDHPESLTNRQSLAASYLESVPPRYKEALVLQARVLDGWRKSFGPGHRSTIKAGSMYASMLFREGNDDDTAIEMYKWCMEAAKERFSPDQPDTWLAVGNYGYELLKWKRYDEAINLLQQSLSNLERILSMDHRDTMDTTLRLAAVCNASGKIDEAEALFTRVLRSKACTTEQIPTMYLWVYEGLGDIYHKRGDNERAKESWQEVLRYADKHWGVHHSAVREAMRSLGVLLIQEGKPDEGMNLLKQVVAWCQEYQGKGSYWTVVYTNELGINYSAIGQYRQAHKILSEIYLQATETLGDMKPETMDIQGNLAYAAHRVDESHTAKELTEDLFSKRRLVLSQFHEDTVLTIANLFRIYLDLQLWPEIELLLPDVLIILNMATEESERNASTLLHLLSEYFSMNGNSSKGEEFFRNQLNSLEERVGIDKLINTTKYCLAYVLSDTTKIKEAEEIMRKVLEQRLRLYEEFSPAIYEAQGLLGVILRDSGNLVDAEEMFEQELRGACSLQNGLERSDIIDAYEHLITIYRKQGRVVEVLDTEQKIADLRSL
jgi:tetratricopeptide (TPR) repeat protein